MKSVVLIVFIGVLGAGLFWYITENNRADNAEAYRRRQAEIAKSEAAEKERLELQRKEDERIRKERAEALAKEDAVRLFLNYIDREEERLKEEKEEAKIQLEKIGIDQNSLSEELQAIERANEVRVASAEKRKEEQRDKVERVLAILRSVTINRLARTYCGEDLSALLSKFEAEVQLIKNVDDKYRNRIKANRRKYNETVAGADEVVDKKLKAARAKYDSVAKQMDPDRLPRLKKQLALVEREIEKINSKKSQSKWDKRDLKSLMEQQVILQNQVSQYEDVGGLAAANIAHMEATDAETQARRKFDAAGVTLTMENDEALLDRDHEQDVYNRALQYEMASLDKVRGAMNQAKQMQSVVLAQAEKKLAYLKKSSVNVDFLNAKEVEDLRRRMAKTISAEILAEDGQ